MVKLANHFGHSLHLDFSGQSWNLHTKKLACTAYWLYLISLLNRNVWVSICYADQPLVGDVLVGKLPKCCKTTSYRCWQFTVALITPSQLLVGSNFKLLAFETSCRWPAFFLLLLTWAFLRQLMRFLRNYHASVNATHPLLTPLSPLASPLLPGNVKLFQ